MTRMRENSLPLSSTFSVTYLRLTRIHFGRSRGSCFRGVNSRCQADPRSLLSKKVGGSHLMNNGSISIFHTPWAPFIIDFSKTMREQDHGIRGQEISQDSTQPLTLLSTAIAKTLIIITVAASRRSHSRASLIWMWSLLTVLIPCFWLTSPMASHGYLIWSRDLVANVFSAPLKPWTSLAQALLLLELGTLKSQT